MSLSKSYHAFMLSGLRLVFLVTVLHVFVIVWLGFVSCHKHGLAATFVFLSVNIKDCHSAVISLVSSPKIRTVLFFHNCESYIFTAQELG